MVDEGATDGASGHLPELGLGTNFAFSPFPARCSFLCRYQKFPLQGFVLSVSICVGQSGIPTLLGPLVILPIGRRFVRHGPLMLS